jgi:hypothetical protein
VPGEALTVPPPWTTLRLPAPVMSSSFTTSQASISSQRPQDGRPGHRSG